MKIRHPLIFTALTLGLCTALAHGQRRGPDDIAIDQLRPRTELTSPAELNQPAHPHKLIIKFRDDARVRNSDAGLRSLTNADITELNDLLAQHNASLESLIRLPQQKLAAFERRAALRAGNAQPDLAGLMRIRADGQQNLAPLARALRALDIVEYVQFTATQVPPACDDISPITPNYSIHQGYHTKNPGLHADCIHLLAGATGTGVTIADVEYGVIDTHEDLCNIIFEPGQTIHPTVIANGWHHHGTAVAGILAAIDNNFGCLGLAPDATLLFFSEWTVEQGTRRETAVAAAAAALGPGDVLLLEMQAFGPNNVLSPAEYDLPIWTITRAAVDAGIIVIAAAGNGGQNLDSAAFNSYMARGDSGAILVGSGTPDTTHERRASSNYGSRVNIQAWGRFVFTLGYGSFIQLNGDVNQSYTSTFGGTSSASAIIAGSVAALQSLAISEFNTALTPQQMRNLLIDTGRPQGGNTATHIGPYPFLARAALALGVDAADCGGNGNPNICRIALYSAADDNNNAVPDICDGEGDLDGNGVVNIFDLLALLTQWGSCQPNCPDGCPADQLVPDCDVNELDLAALLDNWTS